MNESVRKILKTKAAQKLIGFTFEKADFLIPVRLLRESPGWLAYIHPRPMYQIQIVIVPKKAVKDWMDLPLKNPEFYTDFVELTQSMIRDFCLEEAGYRLITNGGSNQVIPQFHVHLVAGGMLPELTNQ